MYRAIAVPASSLVAGPIAIPDTLPSVPGGRGTGGTTIAITRLATGSCQYQRRLSCRVRDANLNRTTRGSGDRSGEAGSAMQETPGAFLDHLSVQIRQVEEAERHSDLLEKMLMLETAPQLIQHLDDLARQIEDANQAEGSEQKRAILNLIDYLDWLDFYHGTEEKQRLILRLRNDPHFREFKDKLREFEKTIDRLQLEFLLDRTYLFERLNVNLKRMEEYKLTIV